MLQDTSYFINLVEEFCEKHGLTLLLDTWDGVHSYIRGAHFFVFLDEKLTEDTLVTNVDILVAPLASTGIRYTVEKQNDIWEITESSLNWMS